MKATCPEIQGNGPGELATFYSPSGNGFRQAPPVNNEYKLAGGGYLSTATDIALLGQAYLDGRIECEHATRKVERAQDKQQHASRKAQHGHGDSQVLEHGQILHRRDNDPQHRRNQRRGD